MKNVERESTFRYTNLTISHIKRLQKVWSIGLAFIRIEPRLSNKIKKVSYKF